MDAFCVQTRADLEADPNALEFFNVFSSKENIAKLAETQQLIQEGYEPGGHRITALRSSLTAAGELLAVAVSSSFFMHTGRPNIGTFYCIEAYFHFASFISPQCLFAADCSQPGACKKAKSRFWRGIFPLEYFPILIAVCLKLTHFFAASDQPLMLFFLP